MLAARRAGRLCERSVRTTPLALPARPPAVRRVRWGELRTQHVELRRGASIVTCGGEPHGFLGLLDGLLRCTGEFGCLLKFGECTSHLDLGGEPRFALREPRDFELGISLSNTPGRGAALNFRCD